MSKLIHQLANALLLAISISALAACAALRETPVQTSLNSQASATPNSVHATTETSHATTETSHATIEAPPTAPEGLQSATVLEMGPNGVLFVGDTLGSAVYAFAVEDQGIKPTSSDPVTIEAIDEQIAAMLGTMADQILISDMVVSSASQNIYIAVHRGVGPNAVPVVLRVSNATKALEVIDLAKTSHTHIDLPNQVDATVTLEFGTPQRILTITDLHYYKGELFVAGISNEEFASTLRRIPYPFTDTINISTVEIYHSSHNQFETRAPIVTMLVEELEGQPYLIAAYTCTPVVRFPLADLVDDAHVVGETIAELGYGNAPVDMIHYTDPYEQKDYLLITNDQRSPVRIDPLNVAQAEPLTEAAAQPTGLDQQTVPFTGAMHIDVLNDRYTVAVRRHVLTHELNLMTVNTGLFFDRSESIVEFNWPGITNPFVEVMGLFDNSPNYRNLTDNRSASPTRLR